MNWRCWFRIGICGALAGWIFGRWSSLSCCRISWRIWRAILDLSLLVLFGLLSAFCSAILEPNLYFNNTLNEMYVLLLCLGNHWFVTLIIAEPRSFDIEFNHNNDPYYSLIHCAPIFSSLPTTPSVLLLSHVCFLSRFIAYIDVANCTKHVTTVVDVLFRM